MPLLNELKIEAIEQIYYKHKIFAARQLIKNNFTSKIFSYVSRFYTKMEQMETVSFISQLQDQKKFVSYSLDDNKVALCLIYNQFECNDLILRDSIKSILHNFDIEFNFIKLYI